MILTDDTNIDRLSSSTTCNMYEEMLHTYQLSCRITNPICKGKKSIDHISSNICKNKVLHLDVLPFATVYSFNDTDDQLDILNKLILSIIDKHAPFVKTIFSRPAAPWIKDIKINKLQHEQDHWRHEMHKNPTDKKCATYRETRNKIKKAIKEMKTQILQKSFIFKKQQRNLESNSSHS